jgi:hypothetical protein
MFDRVVDEIRHGIEQEISIARYFRRNRGLPPLRRRDLNTDHEAIEHTVSLLVVLTAFNDAVEVLCNEIGIA